MNVDELASRAGHDLRNAPRPEPEAALASLYRLALRRRRSHAALAAAAAVVVVLVLTAALAQRVGPGVRRTQPPVVDPTGTPSSLVTAPDVHGVDCRNMYVQCEGGRRYSLFLDSPFEWTLPPGFDAPYSGSRPSREFIETTLRGGDAGVAMLQHVHAAALQASPQIDPSVGTAEGFARWVADRPFLSSSAVRATRLGGEPAWTVEVKVTPGAADGPATCTTARVACYPLMVLPHGDTKRVFGVWDGLVSRYTAVETTESGITVLWSWSTGADIPAEAATVADSVRFG